MARHFVLFLILGVGCYVGLVLFGEGPKFWTALLDFPLGLLPLLLGLASVNYLLRYFRWQLYLGVLGIRIGYWKSFQIFMAGLSLTVTPGKVGEALKVHFLKKEGGHAWSKGLPIVFAERLTDLMGVVVLVGLGLNTLPVGRSMALLGMGVSVFFVLVSIQPNLFRRMVRLLGRLPRMVSASERLLEAHENVKRLMFPRIMLVALLISCAAWFSECLILYFTLVVFNEGIGGLQATFVYALATLAGALSFLPGGLVMTEGSMTGLLLLSGLGKSQAVSATLIVRLCTLWFAVILGTIFLLILQKAHLNNKDISAGENATGDANRLEVSGNNANIID